MFVTTVLLVRARIGFARGDQAGALDDAQKTAALDAAGPPLHRVQSQAEVAWILLRTGRREEAAAIAEDVVAFVREGEPIRSWSSWLIDLLVQLGHGEDAVAKLESSPRNWWNEAAMHVARGNYAAAAETFARVGDVAEEAYWRLRAGEQLVRDGRHAEAAGQLERALGSYRDVGGTHHIREAEALLAVSVTNRAATNP